MPLSVSESNQQQLSKVDGIVILIKNETNKPLHHIACSHLIGSVLSGMTIIVKVTLNSSNIMSNTELLLSQRETFLQGGG